MKVLLAEDSRSNRLLIKAYVEEAGHEVIAAHDGQHAVELFKQVRPDVVIMDVSMPVMDGIQTAREIRQISDLENDWIPIVFLSGMSDSDDIVRGIDAGGDDYLIKPVDSKVLNAKLRAMQRIAQMRQQLQIANRKLELISMQDGLTGLANRRHFDKQFEYEMRRAIRAQTPLSIIMCDIDFFKPYNDNYGHQMGDYCLKDVAQVMKNLIHRPTDVIARYGGEEFVIILPETKLANAMRLADSLCLSIESKKIAHQYSAVGSFLTMSLGVASVTPAINGDVETLCHDLLEQADKALYQAKNLGRNQVFCDQESA